MQTANKTKWQSIEKDGMPEDGELVLLMLPDSRIVKGKYNPYYKAWRIIGAFGWETYRDKVRYWKPINHQT